MENQLPRYMAHSKLESQSHRKYSCKQSKKDAICFSLHKYQLNLSNQDTYLIKINLWPKALSCLLGTILIWIIPKKSRNNSKLEGCPCAKAAYGSCYQIVASLIWMSKKNDKNYTVLLDFKRTFQKVVVDQEIHLPAWWLLAKGQGQESSGYSVESTWCREYTGRWRNSLWCHPPTDFDETALGCRKGGWKEALPPLYHQIWNWTSPLRQ